MITVALAVTGLVGETVADATHGLDQILAELGSQVPDVDVDNIGAGVVGQSPSPVQELLPRQDLAAVADPGCRYASSARTARTSGTCRRAGRGS